MQKIKISTVASKVESNYERQETQDRLDEERRHLTEARSLQFVNEQKILTLTLQACIMRIMKARRHMTHNDLINEVTRQLASRFQQTSNNIKKRIEGLIEVS